MAAARPPCRLRFRHFNVEYFTKAGIPETSFVRLDPGDFAFVKVPTIIDLTRPETEVLGAIVKAPASLLPLIYSTYSMDHEVVGM